MEIEPRILERAPESFAHRVRIGDINLSKNSASQYNEDPDYRAWLRERNPIAAAELDVAMALDADVVVIDTEIVTAPARLESGECRCGRPQTPHTSVGSCP